MANWNVLKQAIAEVIKANGNKEITGPILQNALDAIISNLGENATYAGKADMFTNPGAPDGPVFYLADYVGVYKNFNGIEVYPEEGLVTLSFDGTTWKKTRIFSPVNVLKFTNEIVPPYDSVVVGYQSMQLATLVQEEGPKVAVTPSGITYVVYLDSEGNLYIRSISPCKKTENGKTVFSSMLFGFEEWSNDDALWLNLIEEQNIPILDDNNEIPKELLPKDIIRFKCELKANEFLDLGYTHDELSILAENHCIAITPDSGNMFSVYKNGGNIFMQNLNAFFAKEGENNTAFLQQYRIRATLENKVALEVQNYMMLPALDKTSKKIPKEFLPKECNRVNFSLKTIRIENDAVNAALIAECDKGAILPDDVFAFYRLGTYCTENKSDYYDYRVRRKKTGWRTRYNGQIYESSVAQENYDDPDHYPYHVPYRIDIKPYTEYIKAPGYGIIDYWELVPETYIGETERFNNLREAFIKAFIRVKSKPTGWVVYIRTGKKTKKFKYDTFNGTVSLVAGVALYRQGEQISDIARFKINFHLNQSLVNTNSLPEITKCVRCTLSVS